MISSPGGKLDIYSKENKLNEEQLLENMESVDNSQKQINYNGCVKIGHPLPVAVFNQEMSKALDNQYHNGVYHTGKKVIETLVAFYRKEKSDMGTQTENEDSVEKQL